MLGTAVTPLGWENPLRLAEDLAMVDVLSGGRLNPGISVGPSMFYDRVKEVLCPETADAEDFGYGRMERLLDLVRGKPATGFSGREGFEAFSDRVQTHSPGLIRRMWYGGGSLRSARWAGEHWMNLLTISVVKTEGPGPEVADFAVIQLAHIRAFRAAHPDGRRPVFPRCWSLFLRTRRRPSSGPGMSSTPPSSCPARRRHRSRRA